MLYIRAEHACGIITDSNNMNTVIVARGDDNNNGRGISTTEYLNIETNSWVSGPPLPYQIGAGTIVANPAAGISIIGSLTQSENTCKIAILSLPSLTSSWIAITNTLKIGRYYPIVMPLINSNITICTCKKKDLVHF